MTTIKLSHGGVVTGDSEYDNISAETGTLKADANDITATPTGVSVTLQAGAITTSSSDQATVAASPFIAAAMSYYQWNAGTSTTLRYAGFDANEDIEFTFAGQRTGEAGRDTRVTANGNDYDYDNSGDGAAPAAPVVFTESADASGIIDLTFSSPTAVQYYLSALQIVYPAPASGDSVTPPDPVTDGATAQLYNPAGFPSGAINSVTLDGVDVPSFTQTTFNNFDIVAQASNEGTLGPKLGSVVFEASNGTETESDTTVNQPQADYDYVTMATVDTTTSQYMYDLLQDVSLTLATGDQFNFPDADGSTMEDDGGWNFLTLPKTFQYYETSSGKWYELTLNEAGIIVAPVLASTKALSGIIDQSFSRTLTIQSGSAATSWTITGGADQAEYSLSNAGVLTRDVPNPAEESEVITVTATNAGGTSNTQTVTITYGTESGTRRKRKKTMLRNFYYYREEWEKMSERNKDRN